MLNSYVRKYIMMEKYQARYPEKKFYHMVLPNNIPYEYVLVGVYLEKLQEYSIVYWDLYSDKGIYNLDDLGPSTEKCLGNYRCKLNSLQIMSLLMTFPISL